MGRSLRKRTKVVYNEDALAKATMESGDEDEPNRKKAKKGGGYKGRGYKTPPKTEVFEKTAPAPTRNKHGEYVFASHKEFRPNMSPAEVMQAGSFGGTYWRKIDSAVTGETYTGQHKEFPEAWFKGIKAKTHLTRAWSNYDKSVNRYGVKCGGDLEMWESSGWISAQDPYGWFQWYCRYFLGRRSSDDDRQISRWCGVTSKKGRFRNQLIGKCSRAGKAYNDRSISPVIRQALQHWGYTLTERDADAYVKKKGIAPLPRADE